MEELLKELHKMYDKANTKYGDANIADYEEKQYQMGVMDTIEDVQFIINKFKNN